MNIKLTDISQCPEMLGRVHSLYESAFPVEERREWRLLCDKLNDKQSGFALMVATIDGEFAGFISTWDIPGALYVEHFAVEDSCRGGGVGGQIIDRVVSSSAKPVVLEVEMPETGEMAQRRIGFYSRHRFVACHEFYYIQPSYETGLPLLPLMLMVTDENLDLPEVAKSIHRIVYNADINNYNYL